MFTPFAFIQTPSAPAGPTLWTPANITTLAWYDASNASTITLNGSNVSQINDLSGNGYNATQSSAGLQPAYTATLNGLNVMTFDGSNDKLELPSIPFPSDYQMSVYLVGQQASVGGYQVMLGLWKSGLDAVAYLSAIAGNAWGLYTGNSAASNALLGTNPFFIGAITTTGSSPYIVFSTNGTLYNYPDANPFNGTSVFASGTIGNDQYGSAFNGKWGEAVVVPSYDGTPAREKMEGYLAWKWGLQANLPITSPYYSAPPYV
jgi:hypothetical protein